MRKLRKTDVIMKEVMKNKTTERKLRNKKVFLLNFLL